MSASITIEARCSKIHFFLRGSGLAAVEWRNGRKEFYTLSSNYEQPCSIDYNDGVETRTIRITSGDVITGIRFAIASNVSSLNVSSHPGLDEVICSQNQLTSLNLTNLPGLENLDCSHNQLASLNLTGLSGLRTLNCAANQLTSLNLAGLSGLRVLNCAANQLTSLDLGPCSGLYQLNCSNNRMSVSALNSMFSSLPTISESNQLHVGNNPGSNTCSPEIAENKGWRIFGVHVPVTGITISESEMIIEPTRSKKLTADISPHNATNKNVTWKSLNRSVADVDSTGKVTAFRAGKATIEAITVDGNRIARCRVTVKVDVSGVTLSRRTLSLVAGDSETLLASVLPAAATDKKVTWQSSMPSRATVDANGKVTALENATAGTVGITVVTEDGKKTDTCTVTVRRPVAVSSITLNKSETPIEPGGKETLTAVVLPHDATNKNINWHSSNPSMVTVNSSGVVSVPSTAVKGTMASITASSVSNPTITASCAVTVGDTINEIGQDDDDPLLKIKWMTKEQRDRLSELGITTVPDLLLKARTQGQRDIIASELGINVSMVNSWLKQADLLRVEGMDNDTAFLLAQTGVRHAADLARVDVEIIYPLLRQLGKYQPGILNLADPLSLQDMVQKAEDLTGFSVNQNKFDDLIVSQVKDRQDTLSEFEVQNVFFQSKSPFSLCIEIDEKEPAFLFRTEIGEKSSGKIIREGLDFLNDIEQVLPLPRFISGRIYMKSVDEVNDKGVSYPDALVTVSGIASPSAEKSDEESNPIGYTDSDGRFHIILPDGYNLKDGIILTISKGRGSQKFVRSASDVLGAVKEQEILNDYDRLDSILEYIRVQRSKLNHFDWLKKELADPHNPTYSRDELLQMYREKKDLEKQESEINQSIEQKWEEYNEIKGRILDYDPTTNDLEQTLRNLLSKDLEADLGDFILIEEIFKDLRTDLRRALPSVKLMGEGEDAIHLPTDRAPSRIFSYGMLQRLVEPEITSGFRKTLSGTVDVTDFKTQMYKDPGDYPQMSSLGIGYVLNMHQSWVPDGFALGTLLYSLILAPGEEQRLIVREKSQSYVVSDEAGQTDIDGETYSKMQMDDTTAAFDYAVGQMMQANSEYDYWAKSRTQSGGFGAGYGVAAGVPGVLSVMLGLSGSYSKTTTKTTGGGRASAGQTNTHREASSASQTFQHSIKNAAAKITQIKRASVRTAESTESDSVATKIIANHNHSHAMTIQYWEVVRRYRLETCINGVDLVLFVPLQIIPFIPDGEYAPDLSDFTRDEFTMRYDVLLKYADTLYFALPPQYRKGIDLIKKYAALPDWVPEDADTQQRKISLTFTCNLMSFDDLTASMALKNNKGTIAGIVTYEDLTSNPKRTGQKGELKTTYATTSALKQAIRDIRNGKIAQNTKVTCTFTIPSTISDDDISHITLFYSCEGLEYVLHADKNALKGAAREAYDNMVNKMMNLAQDDVDTQKDIEKIGHYRSQLPEAFQSPDVSLSPREVMNEGVPTIVPGEGATELLEVKVDERKEEDANLQMTLSSTGLSSSVIINVATKTPVLRFTELREMEAAIQHIASDTLHYSQVIWASLSEDERAMMLEQYTINMNFDNLMDDNTYASEDIDIPLLNCVNIKKFLGFYGNCILLPFTYPKALADRLGKTSAEVTDALYRYHSHYFRVPTTTISLPTDGMIGEAVLGESNVSEVIDLTRFWNWKDSPIEKMDLNNNYLSNTDYLDKKEPGELKPLNLKGAEHVTTEKLVDVIAALVAKESPSFENITGQSQLKAIISEGTKSAADARKEAMDYNADLSKSALGFASNAMDILNVMRKESEKENNNTNNNNNRNNNNRENGADGDGRGGGGSGGGGSGGNSSGSGGNSSGSGGGGNSNVVTVYCCGKSSSESKDADPKPKNTDTKSNMSDQEVRKESDENKGN